LRWQLEQFHGGRHGYPDNPDSSAGLRSGSINRGRVHAGDYGRNSSRYARLSLTRTGRIQL
jgi:hypothetical protein